ncbi:hypothetical protein DENSPDRAFT_866612 [Dentipellis sp. KUC8613]|nr:hypothetical protein DENSPDRAFT_866612 [Dentipellis sp. KUC8613]
MPTSAAWIPLEIIEQILLELDPLDVAPFIQTCRTFDLAFARSPDQHFWRQLYLRQPFDDPRTCLTPLGYKVPADSIHWRHDLQRIIRARSVAGDPSLCRPHERVAVLQTFIDLATHIPPATSTSSDPSMNLLWIAATLRGGALLDHELWDLSDEEKQLRAQLHTYFGLTPRDAKTLRKIEARGYVYNMSHYTFANGFGPYLAEDEEKREGATADDGQGLRVNWVHVQALHHDVSMHLVNLTEDDPFEYAIYPMSMPYCQSLIPESVDMETTRDWAGIEGLWHCAFCFIDHRELLLYNNWNIGAPLDPTMFGDPSFVEIFRIIPVNFRIISTELNPKHPTRPKINFAGEVQDDHTMVGHVEVIEDDSIRWHFISGEEGQAIWSGEGVQVGGVRSPFGVIGCWTTIFHDQHDPVGPCWMRRISDSPSSS